MSEAIPTLQEFLKTRVAHKFSEMVAKADQRLAQARREVEDLQAATGTVAWEVGDPEPARWFANLAGGQMTVSEQPAGDPFMVVTLSAADWKRLAADTPAGMFTENDRPFGKTRIDRVRGVKGSMRFVLTDLPGGGDFTVTLHFGGERLAEPKATVQVPADVVRKIQSGALNPQAAFMQGQMTLIGDMAFAMQLGMALFL